MSAMGRAVKAGVLMVLFCLFLYDCARFALVVPESLLSWGAFQGARVLDYPGTRLFVRLHGEGELWNVSRNVLTVYRLGAVVVIAFLVGAILGLLARSRAGREPESPVDKGGSAGEASGLAVASFVIAVVGLPCLGFVLGFIAVVLGTIACRRMARSPDSRGRTSAVWGRLIGAVDIVLWTILLTIEMA